MTQLLFLKFSAIWSIEKFQSVSEEKDIVSIKYSPGEKNTKKTIGEYLAAWDKAYTSLTEKGLLQKKDSTFSLTESGEICRKTVEKCNPLWLYEYNMYFFRAVAQSLQTTAVETIMENPGKVYKS